MKHPDTTDGHVTARSGTVLAGGVLVPHHEQSTVQQEAA